MRKVGEQDYTPFIVFISLSILLAVIIPATVNAVGGVPESHPLPALAQDSIDVITQVNEQTVLGYVIPDGLADLWVNQITAWSYLPTSLILIILVPLIIGGIFSIIKALPFT